MKKFIIFSLGVITGTFAVKLFKRDEIKGIVSDIGDAIKEKVNDQLKKKEDLNHNTEQTVVEEPKPKVSSTSTNKSEKDGEAIVGGFNGNKRKPNIKVVGHIDLSSMSKEKKVNILK